MTLIEASADEVVDEVEISGAGGGWRKERELEESHGSENL